MSEENKGILSNRTGLQLGLVVTLLAVVAALAGDRAYQVARIDTHESAIEKLQKNSTVNSDRLYRIEATLQEIRSAIVKKDGE